MQFC